MRKVDTATQKITKAAQEEIAKSGILQFRAEPELIQKVYEIASEQNVRVSTLLRNWVMQGIESTSGGGTPIEHWRTAFTSRSVSSFASELLKKPKAPVTHREFAKFIEQIAEAELKPGGKMESMIDRKSRAQEKIGGSRKKPRS
jgi:hypothetical protein